MRGPERGRPKTTTDCLFGGRLRLRQPARGYRVNADTLLLASFAAAGGRARRVCDLGAGVGALTLAFDCLRAIEQAVCLEKDPEVAALCQENLASARFDADVRVSDVATTLPRLASWADLVLCNPPFFEPGERRPARSDRERARAGELAPFLDATRRVLGRRGRAAFVYPARTLTRLLSAAEQRGLFAKRMRFVHARRDDPARVVLVELKPGKPGGLGVEPPLVEWTARGVPSPELAAISAGRASGRS